MKTTFSLNNAGSIGAEYGPLSGTRNRGTPGDYEKYMKDHKFDKSVFSVKEEKYNFFKDIVYLPLFFVPQLALFGIHYILTSIF